MNSYSSNKKKLYSQRIEPATAMGAWKDKITVFNHEHHRAFSRINTLGKNEKLIVKENIKLRIKCLCTPGFYANCSFDLEYCFDLC